MTPQEVEEFNNRHCVIITNLGRHVFGDLVNLDADRYVVKSHDEARRDVLLLYASEIRDIIPVENP